MRTITINTVLKICKKNPNMAQYIKRFTKKIHEQDCDAVITIEEFKKIFLENAKAQGYGSIISHFAYTIVMREVSKNKKITKK